MPTEKVDTALDLMLRRLKDFTKPTAEQAGNIARELEAAMKVAKGPVLDKLAQHLEYLKVGGYENWVKLQEARRIAAEIANAQMRDFGSMGSSLPSMEGELAKAGSTASKTIPLKGGLPFNIPTGMSATSMTDVGAAYPRMAGDWGVVPKPQGSPTLLQKILPQLAAALPALRIGAKAGNVAGWITTLQPIAQAYLLDKYYTGEWMPKNPRAQYPMEVRERTVRRNLGMPLNEPSLSAYDIPTTDSLTSTDPRFAGLLQKPENRVAPIGNDRTQTTSQPSAAVLYMNGQPLPKDKLLKVITQVSSDIDKSYKHDYERIAERTAEVPTLVKMGMPETQAKLWAAYGMQGFEREILLGMKEDVAQTSEDLRRLTLAKEQKAALDKEVMAIAQSIYKEKQAKYQNHPWLNAGDNTTLEQEVEAIRTKPEYVKRYNDIAAGARQPTGTGRGSAVEEAIK